MGASLTLEGGTRAHMDEVGPWVALRELLADGELGLSHVAGPVVSVAVQAVATTELADPTPYVVAGQLLLTAGVAIPADEAGLDGYVAALVGAGVGALGVGLEPVLGQVPPLLAQACDRHGLPLVEVPPQTPFVAVGRAFSRSVAVRQQREFELEAQAQRVLVGAAGGSDPIRGVVHQLARSCGASISLFDPDGQVLAAGGRALTAPMLQLGREHAAVLQRSPTETSAAAGFGSRLHLSLHVVPTGAAAGARLVLTLSSATPPSLSQQRTMATALWLLALLVSPRSALDARTESIAALVRLLTQDQTDEVDMLLRSGAGAPGDHWVVVRGRAPDRSAIPRRHDVSVDIAAMRTSLGTPYLEVRGRRLTAVVPCHHDRPPAPPAPERSMGWVLGYSEPVSLDRLAAARVQADNALRTALATRQPTRRHQDAPAGVDALLGPEAARAYSRSLLAPLGDPTLQRTRDLLVTLHAWLAGHGSHDRAATTLQVHRNTVGRRLDRASRLLQVDLDDPTVRMSLWFALLWSEDVHG